MSSQQSMHYKPNWPIMHNTATATEGSSGTTSRSSRSRIPLNKPLVSGWSRIPQDVFGTHGLICHPHLQQHQWWHHQLPTLDIASGPKPGMVIFGHPAGHQNHQVTETGPTPICQNKPKFWNFKGLTGLTDLNILDTWVWPVRVDPWSRWFWTIWTIWEGLCQKNWKYRWKWMKVRFLVKF